MFTSSDPAKWAFPFIYKDKSKKLIIDEAPLGFYLIIYPGPEADISTRDYFFESLVDAFNYASKFHNIQNEQWRQSAQ